MKPEQLVPTRATCEALKEAGFGQDTMLAYVSADREHWVVTTTDRNLHGLYVIAALTLQEVLAAFGGIDCAWEAWKRSQVMYDTVIELSDLILDFHDAIQNAEAAAQLYLRLHDGDEPEYGTHLDAM